MEFRGYPRCATEDLSHGDLMALPITACSSQYRLAEYLTALLVMAYSSFHQQTRDSILYLNHLAHLRVAFSGTRVTFSTQAFYLIPLSQISHLSGLLCE